MFDTHQSGLLGKAAPSTHLLSSVRTEKDAWGDVKKALRLEVGEDVYTSWFPRMDFEGKEQGTVRLSVPTRFLKSWITSHYIERVLACWQAEDNSVSRIEIVTRSAVVRSLVTKPAEPELPRPAPQHSEVERELAKRFGATPLEARYTFDTFVVGKSNSLAHAAARQIAARKKGETMMFNPLYIYGGVGFGKSHLLQALTWDCNQCGEHQALYFSADGFMHGFAPALRGRMPALHDFMQTVSMVLIDDLQLLSRPAQKEFSAALRMLLGAGRQVVIATDQPPSDLEFEEDIRSRLAGGLSVEVGPLNKDLRLEILRKRIAVHKAAHPSFDVPLHVVEYVAEAVQSHGRDLEGALNRLLACHRLAGQPLTLEMAEREVRDIRRQQEARRVRIEDIQRVVARQYNISRTDLISSRRTINIVRPRQTAMYIAKTLTLRSLPEIGRRFGGRDHTTVLHAIRKIETLMGADIAFAGEVEALKRQLAE